MVTVDTQKMTDHCSKSIDFQLKLRKSICKINFAWKSILKIDYASKIDSQNRFSSKVDFTNRFLKIIDFGEGLFDFYRIQRIR